MAILEVVLHRICVIAAVHIDLLHPRRSQEAECVLDQRCTGQGKKTSRTFDGEWTEPSLEGVCKHDGLQFLVRLILIPPVLPAGAALLSFWRHFGWSAVGNVSGLCYDCLEIGLSC